MHPQLKRIRSGMTWIGCVLWIAWMWAGCGSDHIVDATGELALANKVVEFPPTRVGFPTEAPLVVHNSGKVRLPLSIEVAPPFSVTATEVLIGAGDGHRIPIRFDPDRAGRHDGQMKVHLGEGRVETVDLVASAQPADLCPTSPCVDAKVVDGICQTTVREDGASCEPEDLCLVEGVCREGVCHGKPKVCEGGDACTKFVCETETGSCVPVDLTSQCPGSSNPCLDPACDPIFGCGLKKVSRRRCGPADCRRVNVCVDGACESFDTPDGEPCNATCGSGKCRSGECHRDEGPILDEPIVYDAAEGRRIVFDGVTDGAGIAWFVECGGEGCELIALAPEGRLGAPVALPFASVGHGGTLVVGDRVAVASSLEPSIFVHTRGDDPPPRQVDLWAEIQSVGVACPCEVTGGALTRLGGTSILFSASVQGSGHGAPSGFVARLDWETGEVAGALRLDGPLVGERPISDEAGNVYLATSKTASTSTVLSLMKAGDTWVTRWEREFSGDSIAPVATAEGQLVLSDSRLLSTEDGSDRPLGPTAGRRMELAPLLGGVGYFFYPGEAGALLVQPWEPASGATRAAVEVLPPQLGGVPAGFTSPLLSQGRGALVAMSQWTGSDWFTEILEVRGDGTEARRCEVPSTRRYEGRGGLQGGFWIAPRGDRGLDFYRMPSAASEVSGAGWVGPGGNPQGGGKPR